MSSKGPNLSCILSLLGTSVPRRAYDGNGTPSTSCELRVEMLKGGSLMGKFSHAFDSAISVTLYGDRWVDSKALGFCDGC